MAGALLLIASACVQPLPGTDKVDAGLTDTGVDPDRDAGDGVRDAGDDGRDAGVDPNRDGGDVGRDGGDVDRDGGDVDRDGGLVPQPSSVGTTNGGGRASSPSYRVRVTVGGPVPVGAGQSTSYRAFIGTGHSQDDAP